MHARRLAYALQQTCAHVLTALCVGVSLRLCDSLTLLINVTEDNHQNREAVTDVQLSCSDPTAPATPLVETLTALVVSKCTTMRDTDKEVM